VYTIKLRKRCKAHPKLLTDIASKIFIYVVIVFSAVIHEYSHGFVANELGDPTAKKLGRLTLNPLAHIDLIGTVIVPLTLLFLSGSFIGWAKPVPYDPRNLRDRKGEFKIALSGPVANLGIAGITSLLFFVIRLIFPVVSGNQTFVSLTAFIIYVNIFLALFNLIPVPPLDGSKIIGSFIPQRIRDKLSSIGPLGLIIALFLGVLIIPYVARFIFALFTAFGYVFG